MVQNAAQPTDTAEKYQQIMAQAWKDPAFKQRLLASPTVVLQEQGITLPVGREVKIVENTDRVAYFPLPTRPLERGVVEDRLAPAGREIVAIVRRASQDAAFKQRLVADPTEVLREQGLPLPAGLEWRVLEDTDQVSHLVMPSQPVERELTDEELEQVTGGLVVIAIIAVLIGLLVPAVQ
jgi:hypothetical protein